MTVSSSLAKKLYAGNGVTTAFPTVFQFFDASDLIVTLVSSTGVETVQVITTNYTVSGGAGITGTVTMLVAPPTGTTLVIEREVPYDQDVDYISNDAFPAEAHESALDKLTMLAQQAIRDVRSTPSLPITFDPDTDDRPSLPLPETGRVLVGNAAEDGWDNADVADLGDLDAVLSSLAVGDVLGYSALGWVNVPHFVNARLYGLHPDNSAAANTTALNAAMAVGGNLYIPAGTYLYNGGVNWTKPGIIFGDGSRTKLSLATGISSSVDGLVLTPTVTAPEYGRGYALRDIMFTTQSGTPGRDAFHIELPSGRFLNKFHMSGVTVDPHGRYAFSFTNVGPNADGLFGAVVENCWLSGGIYWPDIGDSNTIRNSTITGANIGVYATMVSGAAQLRVEDCNITSAGGAIKFVGVLQPRILGNQIEQNVAYTGSDAASVYLSGCTGGTVSINNINGHSRVDTLRVDGTTLTTVEGNYLTADIANSKRHLVGSSSSAKNIFAASNKFFNLAGALQTGPTCAGFPSGGTLLGNAGIPFYALTLLNSWVAAADTNYDVGAFAFLDEAGNVEMRGTITGGTATPGTQITTLPAYMRPLKAIRIPAMVFDGAAWSMGVLTIDTGGNVVIQSIASNTLLQFSGTFTVAKCT